MRKSVISLILFLVLYAGYNMAFNHNHRRADLIILAEKVYTGNTEQPWAEAVAVSDGEIIFVGSAEEALTLQVQTTRVLEIPENGMVLPGFTDAHCHLISLGQHLAEVNMTGTGSIEEVYSLVRERMESVSEGEWITGRGWDQNDWDVHAFPTWRDLEGTEAYPVYLRRIDGHAAWVNRTALDIASITADTPDPDGGRILRDADGNPTGVLLDNAVKLVSDLIPEPSHETLVQWLSNAIQVCNRAGLTGVHDAWMDTSYIKAYRDLLEREELNLRIYGMLDGEDSTLIEHWMEQGPFQDENQLFTVHAIKLFADGALGSRGAAMLEEYSDDPGNRGILILPEEELYRIARIAAESGFQVCTHAIGDRGNRVMIDVYERLNRELNIEDPRWRMEHAQVVAADDFCRFRPNGSFRPCNLPMLLPICRGRRNVWARNGSGERMHGEPLWMMATLFPAVPIFPSKAMIQGSDCMQRSHGRMLKGIPLVAGSPISV